MGVVCSSAFHGVFQFVILLPLCYGALPEWRTGRPVLIVRQSASDSQKLEILPEGLELLQSIDLPVAPVVVIGPYRSGKSFLLNQLLDVKCTQGFGVGHQRHAETKGIWMWSVPLVYRSKAIMYLRGYPRAPRR